MFLCICGNVFCLLWKCFIYSNFLTGVVKIIVITTNISLITFQFWCGNMLSQVRARLCQVFLRIGQQRNISLLSYNRSEIFQNNNGKNRSETFPHMFGFHSYISFLVWKFLITFGPLGQCTFKNRWLSHTIVIL